MGGQSALGSWYTPCRSAAGGWGRCVHNVGGWVGVGGWLKVVAANASRHLRACANCISGGESGLPHAFKTLGSAGLQAVELPFTAATDTGTQRPPAGCDSHQLSKPGRSRDSPVQMSLTVSVLAMDAVSGEAGGCSRQAGGLRRALVNSPCLPTALPQLPAAQCGLALPHAAALPPTIHWTSTAAAGGRERTGLKSQGQAASPRN